MSVSSTLSSFTSKKKHLVHIEPSMDAGSWAQREQRYAKKFKAGKKYIPGLFEGLDLPLEIEQVALLVFGSSRRHTHIGGGKVLMIADFMSTIRNEIGSKRLESAAIPEPYQLLRALQFAAMYWKLS